MSALRIHQHASQSFSGWLDDADPELDGENLSEFIFRWVHSGRGVVVCNGDFQTYLIAVIGIINDWNNSFFAQDRHAKKRAVPSSEKPIFDGTVENEDPFDEILDQHWFEQCAFKALHPNLHAYL